MPQIFTRKANLLWKIFLFGIFTTIAIICGVIYLTSWSDYFTRRGVREMQPVMFSHRHHVNGAGIDCRYCHNSVETSSHAGMPSTQICMTCHSQLYKDSPALAAVRRSHARKEPLQWVRVTALPDFVYFNHSVHVKSGVTCKTCHGPVEQMAITYKARPFHMKECLRCHRNPAPHQVSRHFDSRLLMNCSACHR